MFYTHHNVYCPVCPPRFRLSKPDQRVGVVLDETHHNYSGCMVDLAECPECGGRFQVSYKVDQITKIER